MKRRVLFAAAGVATAALVGGAVASRQWRDKPVWTYPTGYARIGGPFSLIDQNGRRVTDRDLLGKPTLIFFGYTFCPEVCPLTLAHMTAWLQALGPDADRLNVVFVTVDPRRDTPRQLHDYLSSFDPRIRGLTGTPAAIDAIARQYQVFYQKVPLPGGAYAMEHSSVVYIMDAKGHYTGPISYEEPPNDVVPLLRDVVRE